MFSVWQSTLLIICHIPSTGDVNSSILWNRRLRKGNGGYKNEVGGIEDILTALEIKQTPFRVLKQIQVFGPERNNVMLLNCFCQDFLEGTISPTLLLESYQLSKGARRWDSTGCAFSVRRMVLVWKPAIQLGEINVLYLADPEPELEHIKLERTWIYDTVCKVFW